MKKIIAIAVTSLFAITAMADGPAKTDTGINYNKVELSYDIYTVNTDYNFTGYNLGGSFLATENIYTIGNYVSLSGDSSVSMYNIGLGYRQPIASSTDLFGDISYTSWTTDSTLTGYTASVGAKSMITSRIEITGMYSYTGFSNANFNGFTGALKFNVTDNFYAFGQYRSMSGTNPLTNYSLGVGANF